MNPPDCSIRQLVSHLMAKEGLEPNIKSQVNYGDFILGYVAAGAGITIVPEIVAAHLGNPDLKSIPLDVAAAKCTISLISSSEKTGKLLRTFFNR